MRTHLLMNSDMSADLAVYTAISGGYDTLKDPLVVSPGCRYICYTDNSDLASDVWEIRPLPEFLANPCDTTRRAKAPKVLPHLYLNDFEHSIWVDASLQIRGCMREFMHLCRKQDTRMAMFAHPDGRRNVFEEGATCMALGYDQREIIRDQLVYYHNQGYTGGSIIPACTVMYRRHNDPSLRLAMQDWWNEILLRSRRDQISFSYVMDRHDMPYGLVRENMRDCAYFKLARDRCHGVEHLQRKTPSSQADTSSSRQHPACKTKPREPFEPRLYELGGELSSLLTVIVRTVGERTTKACLMGLGKIVGPKNIFCVNTSPFSEAVRQGFRIALAQGRKWTLVIDADVLVRSCFPYEIVAYAEKLPPEVFLVQGIVHDKMLNVLRAAGNHLYRTKSLHQAMRLIPEEGSTLRPEYTTVERMIAAGHTFVQSNYVVGLHDHEQYYADIAKKCFLHAHKHAQFAQSIWPMWQQRAQTDKDFQAAMAGVEAGRHYKGTVLVDSRFFDEQLCDVLPRIGLAEKKPLPPTAYVDVDIARILRDAVRDPFQALMQQLVYPPEKWWMFWGPSGPRFGVYDIPAN